MDKKVLSIQDISCYGQCSLTVALPIISCFGFETAILPSAVLSTHTGGFTGFTFRDLTDDLTLIRNHWEKENIDFHAIYTGYIGSIKQLDYIKDIIRSRLQIDGIVFVDPAMADNGKLYYGFNQEFADKMGELCKEGDYILPNTTEACFMLHKEWKPNFSEEEMIEMAKELGKFTKRYVILKGATFVPGQLGSIVYDRLTEEMTVVFNKKIEYASHGTGDVFASSFVGEILRDKTPIEAATFAGVFVQRAIEATIDDPSHRYGVKFEKVLHLIND